MDINSLIRTEKKAQFTASFFCFWSSVVTETYLYGFFGRFSAQGKLELTLRSGNFWSADLIDKLETSDAKS